MRRPFAAWISMTALLCAAPWAYAESRVTNCEMGDDEKAVIALVLPQFRKIVQGDTGLTIVERQTDSSHFAQTFELGQFLERDLASGLTPRLQAAQPNRVVIFASPAPTYFPIPKQARADLEERYRDALKRPCRMRLRNSKESKIIHVPSSQVPPREAYGPTWEQIEAKFGKNTVLVSLSRVALDKKGQYAMIHVSADWNGGGCGQLFLLHRENGLWTVRKVFATWTT